MGDWTPCNEDALAAYAHSNRDEQLTRHLRFCRGCSDAVSMYDLLQATLRELEIWQPLPPTSLPGIKSRLHREKKFAEEQVPALLLLPPPERYAEALSNPEYFSAEVVWKLLDVASQAANESPLAALPIHTLAAWIADEVVDRRKLDSYQPCRVAAWKELAWIYRCIGEYSAASSALDSAADAADRCVEPDRRAMIARVCLSRGILLTNMRSYDQALAHVRRAGSEFTATGDPDRADMALEQEANILLMKKDGRAAAAIFRRLALATPSGEHRARRYQNLAHALELNGELEFAAICIRVAQGIHEQAGATHLVNKDRWVLGRILAKQNLIPEALAQLNAAATSMRSRDPHSAVMIDLDLANVELSQGLHSGATYARLAAAATYAIEHRLPEAACRALLFLQRMGSEVNDRHVRFVRDFIEDLQEHPHREFVPPPEVAA